jgi:hypothetical protein
MTLTQLIGATVIGLILAFGWFAFRKGTKVKPEEGDRRGGLPPGTTS